MNNFNKWIAEIRAEFENKLNAFLAKKGLDPVERFLKSGLEIEALPRSLAIYPTSSSGSTFQMDTNSATGRFTIEFYMDHKATEDSSVLSEDYYGALIDFIVTSEFGEYSRIDESVLIRMDDGEPVNGAIFLIESRISSINDFGW